MADLEFEIHQRSLHFLEFHPRLDASSRQPQIAALSHPIRSASRGFEQLEHRIIGIAHRELRTRTEDSSPDV